MRVLFVCRGNVGRSQMAEAFFKKLSSHQASSAGTHSRVLGVDGLALGEVAEKVVNCMTELGFDVSGNRIDQLTPGMVEKADRVIVITKKEDWPDYLRNSKRVTFWDVEDAVNTSHQFHCRVRDKIKKLVENLVREMG